MKGVDQMFSRAINLMNCRYLVLAVFGLSIAVGSLAPGAEQPETSHLAFVTEYIRELAAIEKIRAAGEKELNEGKKEGVFRTAIHTSTLMKLELGSHITMMKSMNLKPPFEEFIPSMIQFNKKKIELHQRIIEFGSEFIAAPKPGVDYGKLAAEMPQVRAKLDYIDNALFEASPAVFATLIDMKPDSKGHASHLIITKAEKAKLIDSITSSFGSKLDEEGQNYIVSTASVLKTYLLKDFQCSDDPWE
jgi:hypothetical protein